MFLCITPQLVDAKEITTLNFRDGSAGRWDVSHMDAVELTRRGMVIDQPGQWLMRRLDPLPHPVDSFELDIVAPNGTDAVFLWHAEGTPEETYIQLPFSIPASTQPITVTINPDYYPQWDDETDDWAIRFYNASNIRLVEMRLIQLSIWDRAQAAWKSFWTPDQFTRYSINFLWGPLVVDNPISLDEMWDFMPPRGFSVFRFIYPILAFILLALIIGVALKRLSYAKMVTTLCVVCSIFWVALDVRMTTELLSYVYTDWNDYILKPFGNRSFRFDINIYDVLEDTTSFVEPDEQFSILIPPQILMDALAVYKTYPALAVADRERQQGLRTWLVYYFNGVSVNDEGYLVDRDGSVLAGPGKIVASYSGGRAFIFQTNS